QKKVKKLDKFIQKINYLVKDNQEFMVKKKLNLESQFRSEYSLIAGVDEAGRGALAGPIVVAAVILPVDFESPLIQDSKILEPFQREKVCHLIKRVALEYN